MAGLFRDRSFPDLVGRISNPASEIRSRVPVHADFSNILDEVWEALDL
jgi:hypothetical protein